MDKTQIEQIFGPVFDYTDQYNKKFLFSIFLMKNMKYDAPWLSFIITDVDVENAL